MHRIHAHHASNPVYPLILRILFRQFRGLGYTTISCPTSGYTILQISPTLSS